MGLINDFSAHRILTIDPVGNWIAPLKTALGDFPCQLSAWRQTMGTKQPQVAAHDLLHQLFIPGKPCCLVLYHCQEANLQFLPIWAEAARCSQLPPLIGMLDEVDLDSIGQLRKFGCAQVYAGLHTLERLVKTVTSIPQPSVSLDAGLEEWIEAKLPWNSDP